VAKLFVLTRNEYVASLYPTWFTHYYSVHTCGLLCYC